MSGWNALEVDIGRECIAAFGEEEPLAIILPTIPPTTRNVRGIVDRYGPTDMLIQLADDPTTGYSAEEAQKYGAASVTLKQFPRGSTDITLALMIPTPEEMGGRPWCDAGMCTYRVGRKR